MAGEKFWRRESTRHMRISGRNQKGVTSNGSGDAAEEKRAPMRMKIVVKKEDLKQVLEAIREGRGGIRRGSASASASLEQRLNLMRRRQILRAASQVKGRSRLAPWRPVLQSIPEEP